ncbi:MAG: nucleotidyltransferase family protein [Lachnospiraceae bacterium]|nr:nucleotidyltransferase family protein [Lachnospiraceae bacterium]MDE6186338.1 nucleotidyltransferase family protein [Lachnospiraceae bacterium]
MKTAAIVAEYNPFHNGHQYQIEETKRQTGADFILVLMSGDFVQRGAPALCNKYIRTKMALIGGADLVIELPSLYALSSAEFFADGAVTLLNQLNVVDILSFGSESGNLSLFEKCTGTMIRQADQLTSIIREGLKCGLPFPAARADAMSEIFFTYPDAEELNALFSYPNNILGMEYCKALLATKSPIRPFTIKREDAGYHNTSVSEHSSKYISASAIRNALTQTPELVARYVPSEVYQLITEYGLPASHLQEDAFSMLLYYKLLTEKDHGFSAYLDCTPDLSDKICKNLANYTSFTDFCHLLKTKEITYTRLSRVMMHILLNIKTPEYFRPPLLSRKLYAPYARLLGFKKEASPLLSAIKKSSSIPLLSKPADAASLLNREAFAMLQQDIFCASVYESAVFHYTGKQPLNELKQSPIILPQLT